MKRRTRNASGLTNKQQKAYDFINTYITKKGVSPTFTEVADGTGVTDLKGLRAKGLISWKPRKARSIVITGADAEVRLKREIRVTTPTSTRKYRVVTRVQNNSQEITLNQLKAERDRMHNRWALLNQALQIIEDLAN